MNNTNKNEYIDKLLTELSSKNKKKLREAYKLLDESKWAELLETHAQVEFNTLYQKILNLKEDELDYQTNKRITKDRDSFGELLYEVMQEAGCCGFHDSVVSIMG